MPRLPARFTKWLKTQRCEELKPEVFEGQYAAQLFDDELAWRPEDLPGKLARSDDPSALSGLLLPAFNDIIDAAGAVGQRHLAFRLLIAFIDEVVNEVMHDRRLSAAGKERFQAAVDVLKTGGAIAEAVYNLESASKQMEDDDDEEDEERWQAAVWAFKGIGALCSGAMSYPAYVSASADPVHGGDDDAPVNLVTAGEDWCLLAPSYEAVGEIVRDGFIGTLKGITDGSAEAGMAAITALNAEFAPYLHINPEAASNRSLGTLVLRLALLRPDVLFSTTDAVDSYLGPSVLLRAGNNQLSNLELLIGDIHEPRKIPEDILKQLAFSRRTTRRQRGPAAPPPGGDAQLNLEDLPPVACRWDVFPADLEPIALISDATHGPLALAVTELADEAQLAADANVETRLRAVLRAFHAGTLPPTAADKVQGMYSKLHALVKMKLFECWESTHRHYAALWLYFVHTIPPVKLLAADRAAVVRQLNTTSLANASFSVDFVNTNLESIATEVLFWSSASDLMRRVLTVSQGPETGQMTASCNDSLVRSLCNQDLGHLAHELLTRWNLLAQLRRLEPRAGALHERLQTSIPAVPNPERFYRMHSDVHHETTGDIEILLRCLSKIASLMSGRLPAAAETMVISSRCVELKAGTQLGDIEAGTLVEVRYPVGAAGILIEQGVAIDDNSMFIVQKRDGTLHILPSTAESSVSLDNLLLPQPAAPGLPVPSRRLQIDIDGQRQCMINLDDGRVNAPEPHIPVTILDRVVQLGARSVRFKRLRMFVISTVEMQGWSHHQRAWLGKLQQSTPLKFSDSGVVFARSIELMDQAIQGVESAIHESQQSMTTSLLNVYQSNLPKRALQASVQEAAFKVLHALQTSNQHVAVVTRPLVIALLRIVPTHTQSPSQRMVASIECASHVKKTLRQLNNSPTREFVFLEVSSSMSGSDVREIAAIPSESLRLIILTTAFVNDALSSVGMDRFVTDASVSDKPTTNVARAAWKVFEHPFTELDRAPAFITTYSDLKWKLHNATSEPDLTPDMLRDLAASQVALRVPAFRTSARWLDAVQSFMDRGTSKSFLLLRTPNCELVQHALETLLVPAAVCVYGSDVQDVLVACSTHSGQVVAVLNSELMHLSDRYIVAERAAASNVKLVFAGAFECWDTNSLKHQSTVLQAVDIAAFLDIPREAAGEAFPECPFALPVALNEQLLRSFRLDSDRASVLYALYMVYGMYLPFQSVVTALARHQSILNAEPELTRLLQLTAGGVASADTVLQYFLHGVIVGAARGACPTVAPVLRPAPEQAAPPAPAHPAQLFGWSCGVTAAFQLDDGKPFMEHVVPFPWFYEAVQVPLFQKRLIIAWCTHVLSPDVLQVALDALKAGLGAANVDTPVLLAAFCFANQPVAGYVAFPAPPGKSDVAISLTQSCGQPDLPWVALSRAPRMMASEDDFVRLMCSPGVLKRLLCVHPTSLAAVLASLPREVDFAAPRDSSSPAAWVFVHVCRELHQLLSAAVGTPLYPLLLQVEQIVLLLWHLGHLPVGFEQAQVRTALLAFGERRGSIAWTTDQLKACLALEDSTLLTTAMSQQMLRELARLSTDAVAGWQFGAALVEATFAHRNIAVPLLKPLLDWHVSAQPIVQQDGAVMPVVTMLSAAAIRALTQRATSEGHLHALWAAVGLRLSAVDEATAHAQVHLLLEALWSCSMPEAAQAWRIISMHCSRFLTACAATCRVVDRRAMPFGKLAALLVKETDDASVPAETAAMVADLVSDCRHGFMVPWTELVSKHLHAIMGAMPFAGTLDRPSVHNFLSGLFVLHGDQVGTRMLNLYERHPAQAPAPVRLLVVAWFPAMRVAVNADEMSVLRHVVSYGKLQTPSRLVRALQAKARLNPFAATAIMLEFPQLIRSLPLSVYRRLASVLNQPITALPSLSMQVTATSHDAGVTEHASRHCSAVVVNPIPAALHAQVGARTDLDLAPWSLFTQPIDSINVWLGPHTAAAERENVNALARVVFLALSLKRHWRLLSLRSTDGWYFSNNSARDSVFRCGCSAETVLLDFWTAPKVLQKLRMLLAWFAGCNAWIDGTLVSHLREEYQLLSTSDLAFRATDFGLATDCGIGASEAAWDIPGFLDSINRMQNDELQTRICMLADWSGGVEYSQWLADGVEAKADDRQPERQAHQVTVKPSRYWDRPAPDVRATSACACAVASPTHHATVAALQAHLQSFNCMGLYRAVTAGRFDGFMPGQLDCFHQHMPFDKDEPADSQWLLDMLHAAVPRAGRDANLSAALQALAEETGAKVARLIGQMVERVPPPNPRGSWPPADLKLVTLVSSDKWQETVDSLQFLCDILHNYVPQDVTRVNALGALHASVQALWATAAVEVQAFNWSVLHHALASCLGVQPTSQPAMLSDWMQIVQQGDGCVAMCTLGSQVVGLDGSAWNAAVAKSRTYLVVPFSGLADLQMDDFMRMSEQRCFIGQTAVAGGSFLIEQTADSTKQTASDAGDEWLPADASRSVKSATVIVADLIDLVAPASGAYAALHVRRDGMMALVQVGKGLYRVEDATAPAKVMATQRTFQKLLPRKIFGSPQAVVQACEKLGESVAMIGDGFVLRQQPGVSALFLGRYGYTAFFWDAMDVASVVNCTLDVHSAALLRLIQRLLLSVHRMDWAGAQGDDDHVAAVFRALPDHPEAKQAFEDTWRRWFHKFFDPILLYMWEQGQLASYQDEIDDDRAAPFAAIEQVLSTNADQVRDLGAVLATDDCLDQLERALRPMMNPATNEKARALFALGMGPALSSKLPPAISAVLQRGGSSKVVPVLRLIDGSTAVPRWMSPLEACTDSRLQALRSVNPTREEVGSLFGCRFPQLVFAPAPEAFSRRRDVTLSLGFITHSSCIAPAAVSDEDPFRETREWVGHVLDSPMQAALKSRMVSILQPALVGQVPQRAEGERFDARTSVLWYSFALKCPNAQMRQALMDTYFAEFTVSDDRQQSSDIRIFARGAHRPNDEHMLRRKGGQQGCDYGVRVLSVDAAIAPNNPFSLQAQLEAHRLRFQVLDLGKLQSEMGYDESHFFGLVEDAFEKEYLFVLLKIENIQDGLFRRVAELTRRNPFFYVVLVGTRIRNLLDEHISRVVVNKSKENNVEQGEMTCPRTYSVLRPLSLNANLSEIVTPSRADWEQHVVQLLLEHNLPYLVLVGPTGIGKTMFAKHNELLGLMGTEKARRIVVDVSSEEFTKITVPQYLSERVDPREPVVINLDEVHIPAPVILATILQWYLQQRRVRLVMLCNRLTAEHMQVLREVLAGREQVADGDQAVRRSIVYARGSVRTAIRYMLLPEVFKKVDYNILFNDWLQQRPTAATARMFAYSPPVCFSLSLLCAFMMSSVNLAGSSQYSLRNLEENSPVLVPLKVGSFDAAAIRDIQDALKQHLAGVVTYWDRAFIHDVAESTVNLVAAVHRDSAEAVWTAIVNALSVWPVAPREDAVTAGDTVEYATLVCEISGLIHSRAAIPADLAGRVAPTRELLFNLFAHRISELVSRAAATEADSILRSNASPHVCAITKALVMGALCDVTGQSLCMDEVCERNDVIDQPLSRSPLERISAYMVYMMERGNKVKHAGIFGWALEVPFIAPEQIQSASHANWSLRALCQDVVQARGHAAEHFPRRQEYETALRALAAQWTAVDFATRLPQLKKEGGTSNLGSGQAVVTPSSADVNSVVSVVQRKAIPDWATLRQPLTALEAPAMAKLCSAGPQVVHRGCLIGGERQDPMRRRLLGLARVAGYSLAKYLCQTAEPDDVAEGWRYEGSIRFASLWIVMRNGPIDELEDLVHFLRGPADDQADDEAVAVLSARRMWLVQVLVWAARFGSMIVTSDIHRRTAAIQQLLLIATEELRNHADFKERFAELWNSPFADALSIDVPSDLQPTARLVAARLAASTFPARKSWPSAVQGLCRWIHRVASGEDINDVLSSRWWSDDLWAELPAEHMIASAVGFTCISLPGRVSVVSHLLQTDQLPLPDNVAAWAACTKHRLAHLIAARAPLRNPLALMLQ